MAIFCNYVILTADLTFTHIFAWLLVVVFSVSETADEISVLYLSGLRIEMSSSCAGVRIDCKQNGKTWMKWMHWAVESQLTEMANLKKHI